MFKFQWPFNLRWLFDISKNRRKKKRFASTQFVFHEKNVCLYSDILHFMHFPRGRNMTFIYHSKTTGRFYLWHWIRLRNNFNHHSWIILIKKQFFKNLLRSGLYDVNVFAPNRFLNFYNGFTISFLKCTTSTQSNIQMSEKKFHHMYFCKNVKKNDIKYFKIMLTWL